MDRPAEGTGGRFVGTEAGVFGCEGTHLAVLVGRTGFVEFVCRTPAAAERAVTRARLGELDPARWPF